MVFHWSLSDSKSPQGSRILLSILAVLNNAVVRIVSTRLSTSKSSSPFNNPFVTLPKAPITIGIIVTFMFHSFFNSLARYLSFFSNYSVVSRDSKVDPFARSLFFADYYKGLVFWPILSDPSACQSPIGVYMWYFLGQMPGCAYTICSDGQIKIFCTSPSGSPCPPNRL